MAAAAKHPSDIGLLKNPFALTPGFEGPSQPLGLIPEYDSETGMWAAPFIMAPINTKNVHRTNALLGHRYGTDFRYDEMIFTSVGEAGKAMAEAIGKMNPLADDKAPQPGEGPSKEQRDTGFYDILFTAEGGQKAVVTGDRDPGYGSTSKMIAESALLLAETESAGGVWTPGALFGRSIIDRLEQHAGLTFARA
jgi:short subunit dehydrogenase-like uncharacterized protein